MKTRKIFSFLFLITLIFVLTSCRWAGNDLSTEKTVKNFQGRLIKKSYSGFDKKFGYETIININAEDSVMTIKKVFIPQRTWAKIPAPNDTTVVYIEYIEDIEYGSSEYPSLWDSQFSLCTGFTVEKITSK